MELLITLLPSIIMLKTCFLFQDTFFKIKKKKKILLNEKNMQIYFMKEKDRANLFFCFFCVFLILATFFPFFRIFMMILK